MGGRSANGRNRRYSVAVQLANPWRALRVSGRQAQEQPRAPPQGIRRDDPRGTDGGRSHGRRAKRQRLLRRDRRYARGLPAGPSGGVSLARRAARAEQPLSDDGLSAGCAAPRRRLRRRRRAQRLPRSLAPRRDRVDGARQAGDRLRRWRRDRDAR